MPDCIDGAPGEISSLSSREFELIRELAYRACGLDLKRGKEQLVSARLGKIIRHLKLRSFRDYYEWVVEDKSGRALTSMIDALTTNFTSFFRENAHFDFLRNGILPELGSTRQIRIWSAACSTGEEPYSLAMCVLDALPKVDLKILATDISTRVLSAAERGLFDAERTEKLGMNMARKYFLRGQGQYQGWYRVRPEVRGLIQFRRLNLIEDVPDVGMFDLISCRNVMIYFDRQTQQEVVSKLSAHIRCGGYLFIGHSESLNGMGHALQYVAPAIYHKTT